MNRKAFQTPLLLAAIGLVLCGTFFSCDSGSVGGGSTGTVVIDSAAAPCADCIVRGSAPTASTSENGAYRYASYRLPAAAYPAGATVYYPTDAPPPLAGIVYCPGHRSTESSLAAWGPFFASHGIVLVTMSTTNLDDDVDIRDDQQRNALDALKAENNRSASPLFGKLSDRFGMMGWSMGGGATWINAAQVPGLKSALSVAGHNFTASSEADGYGIQCPNLFLNGVEDRTTLGGRGQSSGVYDAIDDTIPKILYEVSGVGHLMWYSPTSAGEEVAEVALAFQKTFLEGDVRWAKFITGRPGNAAVWETNIVVK